MHTVSVSPMFYEQLLHKLIRLKEMFAGQIKVPGGLHVASGPDVNQACFTLYIQCAPDRPE